MRWCRLSMCLGSFAIAAGCATTPKDSSVSVTPPELPPSYQHVSKTHASSVAKVSPPVSQSKSEIVPVSATEAVSPAPLDLPEAPRTRPAYARMETLPIDLPTVIRLVDENSPTVGFARARVQEAQSRLDGAEVLWLPNLTIGTGYTRFDGQTQNQRGEVFTVSRGNLFASGGPGLNLDTAEAYYRPLIERRLNASEVSRAKATNNTAELEAISAYIDLVQVYALLEINADTLAKANEMLTAAKNAKEAKLDRTAGDVQRSQTEVLSRRAERLDLESRVGAASARLSRLLLLPATVKLIPSEAVIAPVTLIDPTQTLDQLIAVGVASRPDLAAYREAIGAAQERVRFQKHGPLLPKVLIANQVGGFGGGLNGDLRNFDSRNALNVQIYWELKNLGFGNRAETNQRRALVDQAQFQFSEAQARALAEIVESGQTAAARYESLELAEKAVKEATELYRISKEGTTNVVDAKNLFDALRPLQAIQVLNQARQNYLNAVLDFNRSQFRLFTALGQPPRLAQQQIK